MWARSVQPRNCRRRQTRPCSQRVGREWTTGDLGYGMIRPDSVVLPGTDALCVSFGIFSSAKLAVRPARQRIKALDYPLECVREPTIQRGPNERAALH